MVTQDKSHTQNSKRQKKTPRKITQSYLHNSGLYYLERFASSSENFRRVMRRKIAKSCHAHPDQNHDECHALLEKVIEKFEDLELLNDKAYTRMMVESLRRRGKSARYILAHLGAKGLSAVLIKEQLEKLEESADEDTEMQAALTHARKKKLGRYRGEKEADHKKELAAMARAGFSYDIAKKIVNQNEEYYEEDGSSPF